MRIVSAIITWTVIGAVAGALSVACIVFLYKMYTLADAGVAPGSVSFGALLIGKMQLHWFAVYGAGGGAVLGFLSLIPEVLREIRMRKSPVVPASDDSWDPDSIIRSMRAKRAEEYLANRNKHDSESAPG